MIFIILIFFIIFLGGFGFTTIFLPSKLKKYSFFLSPWIGIALIVLLSINLSFGKIVTTQPIPGTNIPGFYIMILIGSYLLFESFRQKKIDITFKRLSILGLLIISWILYLFLSSTLTINTISMNEFPKPLVSWNSPRPPVCWSNWNQPVAISPSLVYRFGLDHLIALINSISGLSIEKAYLYLTALLITLCLPLIQIAINTSKSIHSNKSELIPSASFLLFIVAMWVLKQNPYYLQIIYFTGCSLSIYILIINIIRKDLKKKLNILVSGRDLIISIFLSSLTIIVPEGFRILFIFLFITLLLTAIIRRNLSPLILLGKIVVLTIIINPIIFTLALTK